MGKNKFILIILVLTLFIAIIFVSELSYPKKQQHDLNKFINQEIVNDEILSMTKRKGTVKVFLKSGIIISFPNAIDDLGTEFTEVAEIGDILSKFNLSCEISLKHKGDIYEWDACWK